MCSSQNETRPKQGFNALSQGLLTRIYNNAQKPKFWAEKIQLIKQSKIIAQILA
jgi:hypothetical protein